MFNYRNIELPSGTAFAKTAAHLRQRHVGLIADCDGVLIDSRKSYDLTIRLTVDFFLGHLTGRTLPAKYNLAGAVQSLRDTGLFSNDWDISFAIIAGVLVRLPEKWQEGFVKTVGTLQTNSDDRSTLDMLRWIPAIVTADDVGESFREYDRLLKLGKRFSDVDAYVHAANVVAKRTLQAFSKIAKPGDDFLRGLLAPVFDEFYHGSAIFRRTWNKKPLLKVKHGFFKNEKCIVRLKEMRRLSSVFGNNLGIASGRDRLTTKASLGRIYDCFNEDAMVFLADEERIAKPDAKFRKPNPYSLIRAAKLLHQRGPIFYVGDTVADLEMTSRANQVSQRRFTYVGVCGNGIKSPKECELMWRKLGADLIVPTFNEVPDAIARLS